MGLGKTLAIFFLIHFPSLMDFKGKNQLPDFFWWSPFWYFAHCADDLPKKYLSFFLGGDRSWTKNWCTFWFWILEFWFWGFGSWSFDLGVWILEFWFWILEFWFLILEFWGFGSWSFGGLDLGVLGVWILEFWFWGFGSWSFDFGGLDLGVLTLDPGVLILDLGVLGVWILEFWFWGFGSWSFDLGVWILEFWLWILEFWFWILEFWGFGSWSFDFGSWSFGGLDLGVLILVEPCVPIWCFKTWGCPTSDPSYSTPRGVSPGRTWEVVEGIKVLAESVVFLRFVDLVASTKSKVAKAHVRCPTMSILKALMFSWAAEVRCCRHGLMLPIDCVGPRDLSVVSGLLVLVHGSCCWRTGS